MAIVAMMTELYKDKYCIAHTIYRTLIFFITERRQRQRMRKNADNDEGKSERIHEHTIVVEKYARLINTFTNMELE